MTKSFTIPLHKAITTADEVYLEHEDQWLKMCYTDVYRDIASVLDSGCDPDNTLILSGLSFKNNTKEREQYIKVGTVLNCSGVVTIDNKGISSVSSDCVRTYVVETTEGIKRDNTLPVKLKFVMLRPCCMNFADTKKTISAKELNKKFDRVNNSDLS